MPSHRDRQRQQPPNPFEARSLKKANSKRALLAAKPAANLFADKRIAESDPHLSQEDKYLARLQRERTRRSAARARFSLANDDGHDDDDSNQQPHNSQPNNDPRFSMLKDDYQDVDALDSDEGEPEHLTEQQQDDDDFLKLKNTSDELDHAERTHREIMDEVVQKSKMHKALRQHQKHETDQQTEALDEGLPELLSLLSKSSTDHITQKRTTEHAPAPKIFSDSDHKEDEHKIVEAPKSQQEKGFHYEGVYQQLAAERRAKPSNRLLTEEEQASRERDRLIELEKKRQARMQHLEDEDEDDTTDPHHRKQSSKKRKREAAGADDLDDDFDISSDDSESEHSDGADEKDDESSDSGTESTEAKPTKKGADKKKARLIDSNKLVVSNVTTADEDIPYVFSKCPSDPYQLQSLFEGTSLSQRSLIVERLRKCFAVTLNPASNVAKLEKLIQSMLTRLENLANVDHTHIPKAVQEIDMLLVHIHAFGSKFEQLICGWAQDKLRDAFTALGPRNGEGLSTSWNASTILVLRAIGRLFPASDMRHPICTPLILLLSEALSVYRMKMLKDVALSLFAAYILLEGMAESARYSGELIALLCAVVQGICGKGILRTMFGQEVDKAIAYSDDPPKLKLSDVANPQVSADLKSKIALATDDIIKTSSFNGRVRNMDIAFGSLRNLTIPVEQLQKTISSIFTDANETKRFLMLYSKSSNVVISKALNPRFTAENGVYRKRPKTSYQEKVSGDVSQSAKRIRKAVRKEERGFARDVRNEAKLAAENSWRLDQTRNEERDKKTRETMNFLEQQQRTWREAEKKQKKLTGKKW